MAGWTDFFGGFKLTLAHIAKQFELSLLGGPGIGKTPGTPAFRVLFGFSWTPDFSTP